MRLRHFYSTILPLLIIIAGCNNETVDQKKSLFIPNPQEIPEQEVKTLEIGQKAPDFNLPGTDGKFYTLKDFKAAEVLVIVFTCNHCPTAQAYEDRIIQLVKDYEKKNVQVVAISPNSINGLLLEELGYSDLGDSYDEMAMRASEMDYNFPYLYDGDTHEASIKYGPVATPHIFVFDKKRILTYTGRIDKSEKPGTANAEDLRSAIDATLSGRKPEPATTKVFGCSTKWAWKNTYAKKVNREWSEKEVKLENISLPGIKTILNNESTKLRLVNIWATWCGPCIIEYPDFVDIHRMYMGRDFEFVSISLDNMDSKDKALQFLVNQSSAVSNFIYSGSDKYEFIEAVDPEWDGALPYTMLIEPGGKIIYNIMGAMDPFELKKVIVEHPMIGRYY